MVERSRTRANVPHYSSHNRFVASSHLFFLFGERLKVCEPVVDRTSEVMFYDHPISLAQLIDVVGQSLPSAKEAERSAAADRERSNQIKRALVNAASIDGRHFTTYPKTPREDYTYDVSWWNDKQQMTLAVEIEWYGVKYALEKLFAAPCLTKLLISGSKDLSSTRDLLEKSLRRYRRHIAGEYYVWLAVDRAEANAQLRAFECKIAGSGHSPLLHFQETRGFAEDRLWKDARLAA